MPPAIAKTGQRLSTEHIASLVRMTLPRAATMETAMNRFRNSGLCNVFMDDNFATSMVTRTTYAANPEKQKRLQEIIDKFL
jgi:hypothetical protein